MNDSTFLTWFDAPVGRDAAEGEVTALISRCLSGEQAAYERLYALHSAMIYRLTYSLLGDRQDAEDATLERLARSTERYCVVGQSLREEVRFVVRRAE